MKKNKLFFIRVLVTLAILFALFKFVPYKEIVQVYKNSQKIYLFLGFFVFFCAFFIGVLRWRFLLSSLGVKISIPEAFNASLSGLFFNLFFPSLIAGDVFRGFSISHRYGDAKKVASSVLMDRFSGGLALTLIALISFAAGINVLRDSQVIIALIILCAGTFFLALVIFSKVFFNFLIKIFKKNLRLREKLTSFHDQLYYFRKNLKVFLNSLLFSLIVQVLMPIGFFVCSKAFGVNLSIINFLIVIPIIIAISLVPITIAGIGTREAAAVYFFSLFGISKSIGLGISLINLVFLVTMGIIGGIFYVSIYHRWFKSSRKNEVVRIK